MAKKKSKGSRKATVLTVKKIEELTLLDNIFMGEAFDDGEQIVVVNGEIQDDTPLGTLMHDFHCKRASDAKIKEVRERLSYMKDSKEGHDKMSDVIERWFKEREEEGVRVMVRRGDDAEGIAEVFPEFTIDEIRAIEEEELAIA